MKSRKITSIFLIALIALFIMSAPVFAGNIRIKLNGQFINLDTPPIVRKGMVFVPLRGIFERMNAKVMFHKDQGKIIAHRGKTSVVLKLGDSRAKVNGVGQRLLFPPFVLKNRTYVPLRFLSESVGCSVNWHPPTKIVSISTKGVTPKKKKKSFLQKQVEGYMKQSTKTKKKKTDSKIKSDIKSDIKGVKPIDKSKTDKKKKDDDEDDDEDINVDDVKLDD